MARHRLTTKKNNVKESIYETQPGKSRSDLLDIIPSGGLLELIGIGAAVARRPLPHHRAYGSVHGGSRRLR